MIPGSVVFYPDAGMTPDTHVSSGGNGHLNLDQYRDPSLLIHPEDVEYLDKLAAAATALAAEMRAAS